jgi:hypothetical protein
VSLWLRCGLRPVKTSLRTIGLAAIIDETFCECVSARSEQTGSSEFQLTSSPNSLDLTFRTEQPNSLDLTFRTAAIAGVGGQVTGGRCAHGLLDAIRKTHLFNSPWEV